MGTGRYLKSRNPAVQVIGVEPDDAMHGLEGLKHMASSIVPGIYHENELDRKVSRSALRTPTIWFMRWGRSRACWSDSRRARRWSRRCGVARGLREGCVVTVFPDFGDKYLSTNLWIGWEQWRKERLQKLVSKWNAAASAIT